MLRNAKAVADFTWGEEGKKEVISLEKKGNRRWEEGKKEGNKEGNSLLEEGKFIRKRRREIPHV